MKKFLFAIAALAMTLTASASDQLKVSMSLDKALAAGQESVLTITESDATDTYVACQMQLVLPSGVTFKEFYDEDAEKNVPLTTKYRLKTAHAFTFGKSNDDKYNGKISVMATPSANFKGTQATTGDALFAVTLVADNTYSAADLTLSSIKFIVNGTTSSSFSDIVISAGKTEPTGVVEVSGDATVKTPAKFVKNGEVIISKNNKEYTAAGAQIK